MNAQTTATNPNIKIPPRSIPHNPSTAKVEPEEVTRANRRNAMQVGRNAGLAFRPSGSVLKPCSAHFAAGGGKRTNPRSAWEGDVRAGKSDARSAAALGPAYSIPGTQLRRRRRWDGPRLPTRTHLRCGMTAADRVPIEAEEWIEDLMLCPISSCANLAESIKKGTSGDLWKRARESLPPTRLPMVDRAARRRFPFSAVPF